MSKTIWGHSGFNYNYAVNTDWQKTAGQIINYSVINIMYIIILSFDQQPSAFILNTFLYTYLDGGYLNQNHCLKFILVTKDYLCVHLITSIGSVYHTMLLTVSKMFY